MDFETIQCASGGYTESIHGAGSPQAQRVMISRYAGLDQKKNLAKNIAGIPEKEA